MTDPVSESTPKAAPEVDPSNIVVRFPGGLKTSYLECDLQMVDISQIELAGHFLIRQANKMYNQVDQMNATRGLVAASGPIPEGLKI